ncbi:FAD-binding and (Fe-S)-binding domain-containing protein [Autumnicola psychrophila]|uniref:FAD-linked oxidase C-terminal domain-containing protein n=1 Tax=Autumnicola psychrophila TaxID=3075592 RepID=A0ABU3DPP3_9FLAO|nr:FAD-linked oxidase C-terminal domain-containing protein [Zunongwangia sp. F225]MDT0685683.1 FAD-linked oxidase C-terminal domain-containing protein [Zunongwangia sp. F225]
MKEELRKLSAELEGDLFYDDLWRSIYATDASVYRELPLAVCYPKNEDDLKLLINFATDNQTSLIPRTAGTSLAGQCVGTGVVVDVSKYFTTIYEINTQDNTVRLQPGVIRDDLNRILKEHGLFFGPNTSTSNRCMIGGMVGNNSSGTTSIKYGTTREKVVSLQTLLSDGSKVEFRSISKKEFQEKLQLENLEGKIYREIEAKLSPEESKNEIKDKFPPQEMHRRNTGYAIDDLVYSEVFDNTSTKKLDLCNLLSGSEGTLAFTTEITLQLDRLPPPKSSMVAAHYTSIEACLQAVVPAMKHPLFTCEMMDKTILDCTKQNLKYKENRFFINGDPEAILMLELRANSEEELQQQTQDLMETLRRSDLGYAFPVLMDEQIELALELRKAGLGLLGNIVGDSKAVACIEDTAVALPYLADYILEFSQIMKKYKQAAVYYAHAGAGELHLRPILNIKKSEDVKLFRSITEDVAKLVKKYNGSMSGEHGDGRVRAEFIEYMIGSKNYQILKDVKSVFDPNNIFNPGKIIDAPPMDTSFRYVVDRREPEVETLMDFSETEGILRMAEKCNGSGDCRKSAESGGTMCPSYRATKNEKDSTRARANGLREFLTNSEKQNKFDHSELKEVFDLCISCKGCKSECPSSVDVAALKAEFQYQYQKANGFSRRNKLFVNNAKMNKLGSKVPGITNFFFKNSLTSGLAKKSFGIAKERSLPNLSKQTVTDYYKKNRERLRVENPLKTVYLFNDEFTNFLDAEVGIDALELLSRLKYQVEIMEHEESGRSHFSKGFLDEAKLLANKNIDMFKNLVSEENPLIGIEPSAILSFRDEYLRMANNRADAEKLAPNCLLIEEFIKKEIALGNIRASSFTSEEKKIKIHGHCHQKALSNTAVTFTVLNLPENYKVTVIPSGCCGMAGSFGYEEEHYEVSMNIGEQTLFPAVRKASEDTLIAANGTSCRHQIKDGTQRSARHPVSILKDALK